MEIEITKKFILTEEEALVLRDFIGGCSVSQRLRNNSTHTLDKDRVLREIYNCLDEHFIPFNEEE